MEFRSCDLRALDSTAWDTLVSRHSFFHTRHWAQICAAGMRGADRAVFLCGHDNDSLIIGMPAVITVRYGLRSFFSMPSGTYGGIVASDKCNENQRMSFMHAVEKYLHKEKFSRIIITDFNGDLSGWMLPKAKHERLFTHVIFLEDAEPHKPHQKIAYDIRAGQKADSRIVRVTEKNQVGLFYDLYQLTERRHGRKRSIYSRELFDAIFDHLHDSDMLYWTMLEADGETAGSQIHFIHGDMLISWQTVSDYEKRHLHPSQLLMHDSIEHARNLGLKRVNLGASPSDADGLIRYKSRWGGQKVEYDSLTVTSTLRKLLRR